MSTKPARTPTYQALPDDGPLWAGEPFRVFFPLGVLASITGVLLWPLFYWGVWPIPPHLVHPRVMIFGFGGAFVCGFLGTAWPRFLEAEALRRWEVLVLAILWLVANVQYLMGRLAGGDLCFGLFALALLGLLCARLRRDRDLPPPGFALALSSVALVCLVAFSWALSPAWLMTSSQAYLFSKLFAYQGFLLLPLMGVGSYLFARFFQAPGARPPTARPRKRAAGVWLAAVLVIVSLVIEAFGHVRAGNAVRLAGVIVWLVLAVPFLWRAPLPNTRAWALRVAVIAIAATFAVRAIWPGPGYALAHILFLGGFGLALLLVADRVSHGHGGKIALLPKRSKLWRWLAWMALLAAATRASADMKASLLVSHHIYAALLWAIVVVAWLKATAPLWWRRSD